MVALLTSSNTLSNSSSFQLKSLRLCHLSARLAAGGPALADGRGSLIDQQDAGLDLLDVWPRRLTFRFFIDPRTATSRLVGERYAIFPSTRDEIRDHHPSSTNARA
jgi:hypothetical protein